MANKYRSNTEANLARWFEENGVEFEYETKTFEYLRRIKKAECAKCGHNIVHQRGLYTADFYIPKTGVIIEAKGRLTAHDRAKMIAVKKANPDADIRFYFVANNKMEPHIETRYTEWAGQYRFKSAVKFIPDEWIRN